MAGRTLLVILCLSLCAAGVSGGPAAADPTPSPVPVGSSSVPWLAEQAAMAQAKASGVPVEVESLTDERTVVRANPETGLFDAVLTAGVARVRDRVSGGWRAPSTKLVAGPDGRLRPEAAVANISVSPGGKSGLVAEVADDGVSVGLGWPEVLPVALVDGSTATYSEVFPGVDLVVRAGLESVETFLVVRTVAASRNPKVRSWSMPVSTSGLSVRNLANGGRSLVDDSGAERLLVPQAMMWDSSGKEAGLSRAADRIEETMETRSADVGLEVAAGRVVATPEAEFLDDPSTVFPVVIDPQVMLADTAVLRVTDDWSKWGDAVGTQGKVGYNGWTEPYYRSRMFYRFSWPVAGLTSGQIAKGEFEYVQEHSPQHDCSSPATGSPGVRAKLANPISSSDKWADRTEAGGGWHPQGSVLSSLAVGHEDICHNRVRQKWNLTTALQTERANYASWTTVTVGLFSDDEGNPYGWRHYDNDSSTSPRLVLTYQGPPQTPVAADFIVSPAGVSTPPPATLTTTSKTPKLSIPVSLEAPAGGVPFSCTVTTACSRAVYTVTGPVNVTLNGSLVTASGQRSEVLVSSAWPAGTYSISVKATNVDTGLSSAGVTIPLVVDPPPGQAPTWSWDVTAWQGPGLLRSQVPVRIQAAAGPGDADVRAFCVEVTRSGGSPSTVCGTDAPGPVTAGFVDVGPFDPSEQISVRVAAKDGFGMGAFSAPASYMVGW